MIPRINSGIAKNHLTSGKTRDNFAPPSISGSSTLMFGFASIEGYSSVNSNAYAEIRAFNSSIALLKLRT